MRIGIYTDSHFCRSSSLIKIDSDNGRYSTRLNFLIKSFQWMYDLFESEGVNTIFNLGDMISSDVIDSETNSALFDALNYSKGTKEYWLVGNHEKRSRDSKFHSLSLIKRYPNVDIVDDLEILDLDSLHVVMKSFTSSEESLKSFYDCCSSLKTKSIIMTHQIYKDTVPNIAGYDLDYDLIFKNKNILKIFNGHVHAPKDIGNYCQVGALTGGSFGDDYSGFLPSVVIYDSELDSYKRFSNPYAILFYTITLNSVEKFSEELKFLPYGYKFLRIEIPISIRQEFSDFLKNNLNLFDENQIISYKLKLVSESNIDTDNELSIMRSSSLIDSLKDFTLKSSTPYSKEEMINFINEYLSYEELG